MGRPQSERNKVVFDRLAYEEWHLVFPVIGFAISFAVFIYVSIRAFRMNKERADELARLPLREDSPS